MNSDTTKYNNPILLYDGFCGLCTRSVQLIIKYEANGDILFTPFQSPLGEYLLQQTGESNTTDTVMLLQMTKKGEWTFQIRSDVVLKIAPYLRFPWRLIGWAKVLPKGIRDEMYNLIAKYRYKIWGRLKVCYLPQEQGTRRFISQIHDLWL